MEVHFNSDKQHTISKSVSIAGVGLHTGDNVCITLKPATSDFGIQFQRIDLPNNPIIKADCDLVVDTSRSTTIGHNGVRISTIEHLLAALIGMGIDNILIEIDGAEVPIMDGSSQPFVNIIEQAGVEEQDAQKHWYSIEEAITYYDEDKKAEMIAVPAKDYQLTTLIDFDSTVLDQQYAQLKTLQAFKSYIAPSRTFCFLHELEMLLENNLIKGGTIDNAIVVVDKPVTKAEMVTLAKKLNLEKIEVKSEGILNNTELHFPNEPARHKLLDVVGDLALIGYPIKVHIMATRPGHSTNVAFAKKIKQYIKNKINTQVKNIPIYDPSKPPIYTTQQIEEVLPHRHPFLLVDKIIELTEHCIIGIKNVTFNEPFFAGHFPKNPVMPGVLQIEALAQVGGILCIKAMPEGEYDTYFLKIDNGKFKQKVVPGDTLILKLELSAPIRRGICEMHGTAYVGNKVVTEADVVAQLVKRNS